LEIRITWPEAVRTPHIVNPDDERLVVRKGLVGRPAKVGDVTGLREYGGHVVR